tara:strand:+ start:550 stop:1251 length:702 start_codon:yes stop_codon:yes gene_type:complete
MKNIKYICAIFFFLNAFPAFADSWYQIEIIIFDRLNPDLSEENWDNEEPLVRLDTIELYPHYEKNTEQRLTPYMIMDDKNNRMTGIFRVLKSSSEYRPLIHLSWQQPATKRSESRYVHIVKNNDKEKIHEKDDQESMIEPEFIEDFTNRKKLIDGSIRIRSNFYLHVDLDLYYFKNLYDRNNTYNNDNEFFEQNIEELIIGLKESRKIKLNEIHYFDNPIYGVILQVSRLGES